MGREIYGALIRVGGTVSLVFAAFDVVHIVLKLLAIDPGSQRPVSVDVYGFIEHAVTGLIVLVSAERLERLLYGAQHSKSV